MLDDKEHYSIMSKKRFIYLQLHKYTSHFASVLIQTFCYPLSLVYFSPSVSLEVRGRSPEVASRHSGINPEGVRVCVVS